MELRLLKYFWTIAEEGTISQAAEVLHLTQPTLSRQLKELEEELGTELFVRENRKMILTERIRELDTDAAEGTYEMYDIDGKTYALPYRTDFWVLYYNKKMFDDAGIEYPENLTWDEYEDLAKKLSKNDGQVYGAYQHIWRSTIQAIAAAQNEANLVEPDYRFMADYYDRALRMQKEGAQMDFGTAKSTKVTYQSQFEEQKAAMMYMGTWYMAGILANKEANKTEVEWGITAIPQKKKGESVTTFGSPTAFAVNKNSKKQKAAQEFIELKKEQKYWQE